jgi:hypothetical protein
LYKGEAGISYTHPDGFSARMDANYVGANNSWKRPPTWYANGSVSKSSGNTTVAFGIYNMFNSNAQNYGLIGAGVYQPQNYYGLAAQGGANSALAQGQEEFGLLFRTYWLTVKFGI